MAPGSVTSHPDAPRREDPQPSCLQQGQVNIVPLPLGSPREDLSVWDRRHRERDLSPSFLVPVTTLIQATLTSPLGILASTSALPARACYSKSPPEGTSSLLKIPPVASSCSRSVTFRLLPPWPLPIPLQLLSPCSLTFAHFNLSESLASQCHSKASALAVPSAFDAFPLIFRILPPQSSVQMSRPQKAHAS